MTIANVQFKSTINTGSTVTMTMDSAPSEDNLLVAFVAIDGSVTLTARTGWTKIREVQSGNTAALFYKRASASESVTQTPTSAASGVAIWALTISEYSSGFTTNYPIEVETGNADNDATKTTTGSCDPGDGEERLIIGAAFSVDGATSWSSQKINGSTSDVNVRGSQSGGSGGNETAATLFDRIDTATSAGNYTAEAAASSVTSGGVFVAVIRATVVSNDRRYGTGNKYGNGRLYGVSATPIVEDRYRWGIDINWDSKYGDENEADYMLGFQMFRGRRSFINPNGQGFAPIETGRARVTLDNSSGRYDAWSTSSPLYPNVKPGKDIRVRVRDLDSGTTYDVFTGVILDIETVGYGADARVILNCEDGWYFLRNNITYAGLTRQNFKISRILNMIFGLENSYFVDPFIYRYGTNFDVSTDTIRWWWSSNSISIADMVSDLAYSFFCKFFVANDGTATFYDRQNSRTSVQSIDQSILLKDISNAQPWINQRDSLKIRAHTRKAAVNQAVWSLSEALEVLEGETEIINPIFTLNGFIVPVYDIAYNPGDYHMNRAEDGSSTDLSSSFIIRDPVTPNDVPGAQYGHGLGDTMVLSITNNSAFDGFVTDFDIFAIPVYESGSVEICNPNIIGSNRRELIIDSLWHQKIKTAKTIVNIYGPQLAAVRQFPVIQFDTRPEGLVPDLFDIETVSLAKLGISSTQFEVGGIEIETTHETGQAFIVRHYLEPHFTSS